MKVPPAARVKKILFILADEVTIFFIQERILNRTLLVKHAFLYLYVKRGGGKGGGALSIHNEKLKMSGHSKSMMF